MICFEQQTVNLKWCKTEKCDTKWWDGHKNFIVLGQWIECDEDVMLLISWKYKIRIQQDHNKDAIQNPNPKLFNPKNRPIKFSHEIPTMMFYNYSVN